MKNILDEKVSQLSITLSEKQKEQFIEFYEILIEWNKVMNLTAITEYEEVIEKHFVDSLSLIKVIPYRATPAPEEHELRDARMGTNIRNIESIIDIGTGAGFPGIPLKIAFPQLKITLLDSLNKRVKFLDTVIEKLELDNIETIHGRAEDYAKQKDYRQKYDVCVSRAVANLATLSEYCIPYVRLGGLFIPYKSGKVEEEIKNSEKAVSILGGNIEKIIKFQLPGTDMERSFVKIKKVKDTPKKYPRKAGMPTKEPL